MQVFDYYNAAKSIAGARTIITKRSEVFANPKSNTETLAYAAAITAKELFNGEHLDGLAFVKLIINFN